MIWKPRVALEGIVFGLLLVCVASGPSFAGWEEANSALLAGDTEGAAKLLRRAARKGDARAQYSLAVLLLRGEGVAYNSDLAARWLRRAVDSLHLRAHVLLGNLYASGEGVERDDTRAMGLYRLAAERGSAKAQVAVASMLYSGRGADRDDEEAFMWLLLAQNQGESSAKQLLERLSEKLAQGQQSRAFERAMAWTPTDSGPGEDRP
ncbi:sel1 repeat family protein [Myxococcota bacterium]|nr:sel1 repeat family protein [Myxococcota bacterium]